MSHRAEPWGPRATVDLQAIVRNVRHLRARLTDATDLLAAVKANAYGHGLVPVARALAADGVGWFGVATASEAAALRAAGIEARILVFGPLRDDALATALAADADLTVCDVDDVEAVANAVRARAGGVARLHLKIDTGMGRLGRPPREAVAAADRIEASGQRFEAAWTHFARADEPSSGLTEVQLARFHEALDALAAADRRPRLRHAANSGALLARDDAHFDLVRPGISVYGHAPGPELSHAVERLVPALTLDAPVVFVKRVAPGDTVSYGQRWTAPRETTVATIRIGYGDGYPRALTNLGDATLRGVRCRVVGTVCMDQLMLDVGDLPVRVGDRAILFGADAPRADDLAERIGTIPYELLTRVGDRVERVYSGTDRSGTAR